MHASPHIGCGGRVPCPLLLLQLQPQLILAQARLQAQLAQMPARGMRTGVLAGPQQYGARSSQVWRSPLGLPPPAAAALLTPCSRTGMWKRAAPCRDLQDE